MLRYWTQDCTLCCLVQSLVARRPETIPNPATSGFGWRSICAGCGGIFLSIPSCSLMLADPTSLVGSYSHRLVALSVVIAIFASYSALDLAGRVTAARGRVRSIWLMGGASAMGLGIWSMHYIGMLAFILPIPVFYNWPMVVLSLLAAMHVGLRRGLVRRESRIHEHLEDSGRKHPYG